MIDDDAVFNQALEFMTNGGEMPAYIKVTKDKFFVACLRELRSGQLTMKSTQEKHHNRIGTIETILKVSGLSTMGGGVLLLALKIMGVL